mgnify:FL=1
MDKIEISMYSLIILGYIGLVLEVAKVINITIFSTAMIMLLFGSSIELFKYRFYKK